MATGRPTMAQNPATRASTATREEREEQDPASGGKTA